MPSSPRCTRSFSAPPAPPSGRNATSVKFGDPSGFREVFGFFKGLGKKLIVARIIFQTHPGLAYFGFKYGEKVDLEDVALARGKGNAFTAAAAYIGCGTSLAFALSGGPFSVATTVVSCGYVYVKVTGETLGQVSPYIESP
jgi:hypothetical protein